MLNETDLLGLTEEQADRFREFDRSIAEMRDGLLAWHRLLDRRRHDRKLGLHPIAEFTLGDAPEGEAQGSLMRKEPEDAAEAGQREPFFLSSEAEARGLLLRCIGYLTDEAGNKLAADKGIGGRDKMAEWIIREIKERGALAYIARHQPRVFGIPLMAASS
jgi:hypothetical protein